MLALILVIGISMTINAVSVPTALVLLMVGPPVAPPLSRPRNPIGGDPALATNGRRLGRPKA